MTTSKEYRDVDFMQRRASLENRRNFPDTFRLLYSQFIWNCLLLRQVTLVDEEGCVFIKWVDRTVSKVKPQELYKVDTEVRS